ncbi:MAG TPA: hypothetical protein VGF79_01335 [Bacteroidia bacterium]
MNLKQKFNSASTYNLNVTVKVKRTVQPELEGVYVQHINCLKNSIIQSICPEFCFSST